MNLKNFFSAPAHSTFADFSLLLLRVVVGFAFVLHGWGKIQTPLSWMGPDAAVPGVFQGLAALSEFGGGIAWMLGLVTPLAALGIACTMCVAIYLHAIIMGDPFVPSGPGETAFELAAVYLSIALLLIAHGPGRYSLDRMLFGPRGQSGE